jgi:NitT/TauT family transport system permease protein
MRSKSIAMQLEPPAGVARAAPRGPGADMSEAKQARIRAIAERERAHQGGRWAIALQSGLYPTLALVGVIVLWEAATRVLAIPAYLLPAPTDIVNEMIRRWATLSNHRWITLVEILAGFAASIAVGVPLAVLITYSRAFERMIYPLLVSAQTIPKVALAPLFIVWFGFGLTPKIVVAFLVAFFPVVIGTVVGLRSVRPEMLYLVSSMGASPWQAFWKIRFPNALPSIFGGLKVAITLAVVGAVVGEFVGADKGLGYLIQVANGNLDGRFMFAAIMDLSVMGIILFFALDVVERRMLRWHVSERVEQMQSTL